MTNTPPNITGLREKVQEHITDLLNNHFDAVAERLLNADDGKVTFGFRVPLCLVKGRAFVAAKMSGSDPWSFETELQGVEFTDPGPGQIKMEVEA